MKPSQRDYKPPFGGSWRSEKNKRRRARVFSVGIVCLLFAAWLYWRQEEIKKSQNFRTFADSLNPKPVAAPLVKNSDLQFSEKKITEGHNIFHLRWSKDSSFFSLLCGEGERSGCFEELKLLHPELPGAVMEQASFLSPKIFWDSSSTLELDFQKLKQGLFILAQVTFMESKSKKPNRFFLQRDNTKAILDSSRSDTLLVSGEFCAEKKCKKFWSLPHWDNISQMVLRLSDNSPKNMNWNSKRPHELEIINIKSQVFIPGLKSTLIDMEVLSNQKYSVILYCGNGNYLEIKNLKSLKEHLRLGYSLDEKDTLGVLDFDPRAKTFNLLIKWNQLGVNIPWDKKFDLEDLGTVKK